MENAISEIIKGEKPLVETYILGTLKYNKEALSTIIEAQEEKMEKLKQAYEENENQKIEAAYTPTYVAKLIPTRVPAYTWNTTQGITSYTSTTPKIDMKQIKYHDEQKDN